MTENSKSASLSPLNNPQLSAQLKTARDKFNSTSLKMLFESDLQRFQNFQIECGELILDFSKNHIDATSLQALCAIASAANLKSATEALFSGARVNNTENRAALHTALRAPIDKRPQDIAQLIESTQQRVYELSKSVSDGSWKGHTGKRITSIVNIGIGGSDLGPAMTVNALSAYQTNKELDFHFVSNVDPTDITTTLEKCSPETTLFIIASKTFTTLETLSNAHTARQWFLKFAEEKDIPHHFIAISTNSEKVSEFGIDPANMLPMWDWVGGRYSIWSAIGLPLCIAIGEDGFKDFLAGAHTVDQHFYNAPMEKNAPVLMALLSIWYSEYFGTQSHGILCYEDYLDQFPDYLQQLDMESNGKCVTKNGEPVSYKTGIPVWGNVGSNSQHSFHQLLHQGTITVAVDFIVGLKSCNPCGDQQANLYANCLAQSQALMNGKSALEVAQELQQAGADDEEIKRLTPHKVITGNKPSTTIVYPKLTPSILGQLIALYEQKVFAQSVIWGINPFDQWGVELGKKLSGDIFKSLNSSKTEASAGQQRPHTASTRDSSTQGLIDLYNAL